MGRPLKRIMGFEDYDPKYRTQDQEAYDLFKRDLREEMYQTALQTAVQREEQAYQNLAESRGLQLEAIDRIRGDGRSYVQEQAGQLMDRTMAQTASLGARLPTGANTSAMARDLIRAQGDQAAAITGQANVARIAEERQRNEMLSNAARGLSGLDFGMAGMAGGQRGQAQAGLTGLSGMVSQLAMQREQDALSQHMNLERLRQAGIDSSNRSLANMYGAVAQAAMPFITPKKPPPPDSGLKTDMVTSPRDLA